MSPLTTRARMTAAGVPRRHRAQRPQPGGPGRRHRGRSTAPFVVALLLLSTVATTGASWSGPAPTEPAVTPVGRTARIITTVAVRFPGTSTTPTTVGGIREFPRPPRTVPFTTRKPNGHVSPVFAELSIGGGLVFLLLVVVQSVLTRPGRRGHRTL